MDTKYLVFLEKQINIRNLVLISKSLNIGYMASLLRIHTKISATIHLLFLLINMISLFFIQNNPIYVV